MYIYGNHNDNKKAIYFSCPSLWLFSKSADIFGLHNWYMIKARRSFSVTHLTLLVQFI